jgi:hypothetical protein
MSEQAGATARPLTQPYHQTATTDTEDLLLKGEGRGFNMSLRPFA